MNKFIVITVALLSLSSTALADPPDRKKVHITCVSANPHFCNEQVRKAQALVTEGRKLDLAVAMVNAAAAISKPQEIPSVDRWSPEAKILAVGVATAAGTGFGLIGGWATGEAERHDEQGVPYRDTRLDSALLGAAIVGGSTLVISSAIALLTD